MEKVRNIMIVAGEASGDLHGAGLVRAMKKADPQLRFFGMGGSEMKKSGVELLYTVDKLAVMGLAEVVGKLFFILAVLRNLKEKLESRKPDLLILIDSAEFNLRLAKAAKLKGVRVYYYITPKVWVWRKGRVKKLAKYTDMAGVILPFEEAYLKKFGVKAEYIGNPVVDSSKIAFNRDEFCRKYDIQAEKALVGILPGSRKKEVSFLLPIFLEAARRMQKKYSKEIVFLIPLASTVSIEDLEKCGLKQYQDDLDIEIFSHDRYEMMAACDGVIAASGTATLELAILNTPMVVAYKFAPLSYFIGKLFINIPYFSLVNILADRPVVVELLQEQVDAATIELELARILFDEHIRREMKKDFAAIRKQLGNNPVSEKSAALAFSVMDRDI